MSQPERSDSINWRMREGNAKTPKKVGGRQAKPTNSHAAPELDYISDGQVYHIKTSYGR